ncbi:MAG: penicillin-binding protein 2 [bacterium]|nr:penicillin-binding protein 2 [bacterium]
MKQEFFHISLFILGLFFTLFIGCFYLQIIKGNTFKRLSERNRIRLIPIPPDRGMIFDRNGTALAINQPSFSVSLIQTGLSSDELNSSLKKISSLIGFSKKEALKNISEKRYRPFEPALIADFLSKDDVLKVAGSFLDIPGILIQPSSKRQYPEKELACHLLGYIGRISEEEFREIEGYNKNGLIGKTGIEKYYEGYLRGKEGGEQIETDVNGRMTRILGKKPSVSGANLYLTIDAKIQRVAEQALGKNVGSIVVLDVRNGAILSLVSKPNFDPNCFTRPLTAKEVRALFQNSYRPMFNRVIQAQYSPGSLFKIIDAYVGLEKGIIDPRKTFFCTGKFKIGNRNFSCFESHSHGNVDFISGIAHSCNIYFYRLGLEIGAEPLIESAARFGLGKKTGIDLLSEKKGYIPTPTWKEKIFKTKWYQGDTANLSIGQGYLLVTPIQMAVLTAAIANGGTIFRPFLVNKIEYPDRKIERKKPIIQRTVSISPRTKKMLDDGLSGVVEYGTGQMAKIAGVRIAGKTGTVQTSGKDHAWFVCYAPIPNPTVAMAILVEHGGKGGIDAAPIAREILKEYMVNSRDTK